MITTAVITDAGIASRYMPYTKSIPKGMLPLGNKPVMHLIVEECIKAGVTKIIIVTNDKGKSIYGDYFNSQIPPNRKKRLKDWVQKELESLEDLRKRVHIEMAVQSENLPYGNGTPLLSVRNSLKDEEVFLYLYGDNITFGEETSAEALVNEYQKDTEADAYIAVKKVSRAQISQHASIVIKDRAEKIIGSLVEKPIAEEAPSLLASYGRYLLKNSIFDYLKEDSLGKNNELWTSEAISKLAKNEQVKYVIPNNVCMTTGDPDNYHKTCLQYYSSVS